ncbi:hypothetical protein FRC08_013574 [Ceratobasidium sp. 394]|nr:hypothetical protein FRC08_013574 [Ceratobasidium sp. 394]
MRVSMEQSLSIDRGIRVACTQGPGLKSTTLLANAPCTLLRYILSPYLKARIQIIQHPPCLLIPSSTMSSPSSSTTPARGTPPKRLTLTAGPRPLHLGTGSFPSPSRSTSSPLATPPTTAPLPPRRLGSVSHIARDDLAIDDGTTQPGRSSLVRGGSLREAGGRRGRHGASASVALGGAGEGALERAQKEILERKRLSASSLGAGSEDQPPAVLTLAEKHKDLLHFIAQKESKCVELRAQLAAHEADLLQLKKKWEKIVAKGNGQGRTSDSHTGLSLGRLDATGAVDLKWEELTGTETYTKSTKRASTLLSDMSSALTTTLNALAPPAPSLTRSSAVGGVSPRPSPSIKLTTAKSKPSMPSKSPSAAISASARPNPTTAARPVSLLDDDDGNEGAGLGAVLQPSPGMSVRSKLSDLESSKLGSDTFGEDWNW